MTDTNGKHVTIGFYKQNGSEGIWKICLQVLKLLTQFTLTVNPLISVRALIKFWDFKSGAYQTGAKKREAIIEKDFYWLMANMGRWVHE